MELKSDCSRCVALCCVALALARSADFGIDKPAGLPCPNLRSGFRCGIHAELRERGFPGCVAFDCYGAGQHLTESLGRAGDWRTEAAGSGPVLAAFQVMRDLHELAWHLNEATTLPECSGLGDELSAALAELSALTGRAVPGILEIDVAQVRLRANRLLRQASHLARIADQLGPDLSGADLVGRNLRTRHLRAASLRGARLIGADLRRVDLSRADLAGADLRGADLRGAALASAIFVTQSQLESARGDGRTTLPPGRVPPAHWH